MPNAVDDISGDGLDERENGSVKTETPNQDIGSFSGKTETSSPNELVGQTTQFG